MDAATAGLIGASIGLIGGVAAGWGAALIAGHNQQRLALVERRTDAYISVLQALYRAESVLRQATNAVGTTPDGANVVKLDLAEQEVQGLRETMMKARAQLVVGSSGVRQRMETVWTAFGRWTRWPEGDELTAEIVARARQGNATIDELRPDIELLSAGYSARLQLIHVALGELELGINAELTPRPGRWSSLRASVHKRVKR